MLKILLWLLIAINGALFALGQGLFEREPQSRHEPRRLAEQLRPEQLQLLPAKPAASSALPPPDSASPQAAPPAPAPIAPPPAAAPVTHAAAPAPLASSAPAPTPAAAQPPQQSTAAAPSAPASLLACVEIGNFDRNEARAFQTRLTAARLTAQATQHNVQEVASYMVFIPEEDGRQGAERRAAELRRLGLTDFYIMPESSPRHDAISLGLFKTETAAKAHIGNLIALGVRSARIAERTASSNKVAFQLRNLNPADQTGFAALSSAFPNQSRRDCRG
jgi:hypothetical protein